MQLSRPSRLQIFFDGACPLCRNEVSRYQRIDRGGRIEWVDISQPHFDAAAYSLDNARVQQMMHARAPDGRVYTQVDAFIQIWQALPPTFLTTLALWILRVPGMMPLARAFYRLFARNRYRLTGRCTSASCAIHAAKPSFGATANSAR